MYDKMKSVNQSLGGRTPEQVVQGELASPMCTPPIPGTTPSEARSFYGPNMPEAVAAHAPTPSTHIPVWAQFDSIGWQTGPMDSPFTTAHPVNGASGGEGHAPESLSSPANDSYRGQMSTGK